MMLARCSDLSCYPRSMLRLLLCHPVVITNVGLP